MTPEEARLWARVAETVKPMPGRMPLERPQDKPVPAGPVIQKTHSFQAVGTVVPPPNRPEPFDLRLRQKLDRGRMEIDARIDLHGLRQDEAHRTLRAFLRSEQARGSRTVLVITGKGKSQASDPYAESGVLKRQVPHWLAAADISPLIVSYGEAGRGHGGEGALYVRLRRRDRSRT